MNQNENLHHSITKKYDNFDENLVFLSHIEQILSQNDSKSSGSDLGILKNFSTIKKNAPFTQQC